MVAVLPLDAAVEAVAVGRAARSERSSEGNDGEGRERQTGHFRTPSGGPAGKGRAGPKLFGGVYFKRAGVKEFRANSRSLGRPFERAQALGLRGLGRSLLSASARARRTRRMTLPEAVRGSLSRGAAK